MLEGREWMAARRLAPLIAAASGRIDTARELPEDLVDALHEAGLFRLLLPKSLGGAALAPADFVRVIETLASADAASAWCVCQTAGCSLSAGYLAPDAAREVFGAPRAVLAWGAGAVGKAEKVAGGYRVNGKWGFASGSRHATWLGGHCRVVLADGGFARDESGALIERTMLFPREYAEIEDNWQVIGLRGTGSDSYAVSDLFVPDHLTLSRDINAEIHDPAPLYRFNTNHIYACGFASVALGLAGAMMADFIALAAKKTPRETQGRLAESASVQGETGRLHARLEAARSFIARSLEEGMEEILANGSLSLDRRMTIRAAASHALAEAREITVALYHAAGVNAIFNGSPFERRFRDSFAVSQQVQARSNHFETVGRHLLGLPPDLTFA
jgi:alkylation response protein AidB-like acyl-CoA dehydrogenase